MRRDATATVPTAKSFELPIIAYTNGGTKLESARAKQKLLSPLNIFKPVDREY